MLECFRVDLCKPDIIIVSRQVHCNSPDKYSDSCMTNFKATSNKCMSNKVRYKAFIVAGDVRQSSPFSWRDYYPEVIGETDDEMLAGLVLATEHAIAVRLQQLENSADRYNERIELKRAAADLLVIKTYKLGWLTVPTPSDPMA
jgi:hypothetical protein